MKRLPLLVALPLSACAAAEAEPVADPAAVAAFLARDGNAAAKAELERATKLDRAARRLERAPIERAEGMISRLAR